MFFFLRQPLVLLSALYAFITHFDSTASAFTVSMSSADSTTSPLPRLSGACLCGAVKFSFQPKSLHADACHCKMCRTWSGGIALALTSDGPVEFVEGKSNIQKYKSSEWGERCFCQTCGTNLFMNCPEFGYYGVSAGVLDEIPPEMTLSKEIFIDKKPNFYSFAQATETLTEEQFLAQFSSSSGEEEENDK